MWSRAAILLAAAAAGGCASNSRVWFEARPLGGGRHAMKMATLDLTDAQHERELDRRAREMCEGPYAPAEDDRQVLVTVCIDACDAPIRIQTTMTVSCGEAA